MTIRRARDSPGPFKARPEGPLTNGGDPEMEPAGRARQPEPPVGVEPRQTELGSIGDDGTWRKGRGRRTDEQDRSGHQVLDAFLRRQVRPWSTASSRR